MHVPSPSNFEDQANRLAAHLYKTPVYTWDTPLKQQCLGSDVQAIFKLELFQKTGSFKARAALTVVDKLSPDQKAHGVVAGTGGNHGVAVAYASKTVNISAKVVVPKTINRFRLNAIKSFGADVIQAENISSVFDEMQRIAELENRTIMHPFEGPLITLGAGTLGFEFFRQQAELDAIIVPIGGGGLASGISCAIKQLNPRSKVYGVEPVGANAMYLSLQEGRPLSLRSPNSIADSLCSPRTEQYSFDICRKFLDDVVLIEDNEIQRAMKILFEDLKLAVEPAGAAATAALLGPLKGRCKGLKVGIIVCGSNIDIGTFQDILERKLESDQP